MGRRLLTRKPEPTNPDDVLGHAAIRKALKPYGVGVATGEAAQNRVTFKQLLQAEATDVAQIDAVRLGSVNECLVCYTKHPTPSIPGYSRRIRLKLIASLFFG